MNKSDRNRLVRIQAILEAVPFSASGTATTTGYGAIMFEQDMRALRLNEIQRQVFGFTGGQAYSTVKSVLGSTTTGSTRENVSVSAD